MNIIEQHLCRALCYGAESNSMQDLAWREGYLGWIERMGYPIVKDESVEDKDNTTYYIGCRAPNCGADWGLPFPQAKFYIPENMRHTITRYTGFHDLNGVKVFNGDIIQNIEIPSACYYIMNNEAYDIDDAWYFLREYAVPHTNKFDSHVVVGNVFEWKKLNKEALEWFKATEYYKEYYKQNIRGD